MTTAIWIIAICEVVRLVQNTMQLLMMNKTRNDDQLKRATDEFVKSLNRSDEDFVKGLIDKYTEQMK